VTGGRGAGAEWGEAGGGSGVWGGEAAGAPHTLPGLPIPATNGMPLIPLAVSLHMKQAIMACLFASYVVTRPVESCFPCTGVTTQSRFLRVSATLCSLNCF